MTIKEHSGSGELQPIAEVVTSFGEVFVYPLNVSLLRRYQELQVDSVIDKIKTFLSYVVSLFSVTPDGDAHVELKVERLSDDEVEELAEVYVFSNAMANARESILREDKESAVSYLNRLLLKQRVFQGDTDLIMEIPAASIGPEWMESINKVRQQMLNPPHIKALEQAQKASGLLGKVDPDYLSNMSRKMEESVKAANSSFSKGFNQESYKAALAAINSSQTQLSKTLELFKQQSMKWPDLASSINTPSMRDMFKEREEQDKKAMRDMFKEQEEQRRQMFDRLKEDVYRPSFGQDLKDHVDQFSEQLAKDHAKRESDRAEELELARTTTTMTAQTAQLLGQLSEVATLMIQKFDERSEKADQDARQSADYLNKVALSTKKMVEDSRIQADKADENARNSAEHLQEVALNTKKLVEDIKTQAVESEKSNADQIKVAVWAIGVTAVLTLASLVMTVYYSQISNAESQKFIKWQDELLLTIKNESQQLQRLQKGTEPLEAKVKSLDEITSSSTNEERVIDKAEEQIESLPEPTPAL